MTQTTAEDVTPPLPRPPRSGDLADKGTLYAPTLLSWEAGLFVEDACPMQYDIEDTLTWIVVGDTNTMLNLQLTDRALVNLASLINQAAQAMLHDRGARVSQLGGASRDRTRRYPGRRAGLRRLSRITAGVCATAAGLARCERATSVW